MQSKGSSSLLDPGDCKLSIGSMLGGGITDGARIAIADFFNLQDCVTTLLASMRCSIIRVARIVSPHRILCLLDCLYLRVEIIRWRSDNCIAWIQFLARLRLSVVVRQITYLYTGVLNSDEQVHGLYFRSL